MTIGVGAGVAGCAEGVRQESVGISNRLLTPCHTRLRRLPRGPFSYQGVSTRGVRHSPGQTAALRAPSAGDDLRFGDSQECTEQCGKECWTNLLGQQSCRTKVSRIFRFFVPNFAPNFAPNFPRIFRGVFVLHFVGDGDQKKFTKNPRHFSMQTSQANLKKNPQNFSGERSK